MTRLIQSALVVSALTLASPAFAGFGDSLMDSAKKQAASKKEDGKAEAKKQADAAKKSATEQAKQTSNEVKADAKKEADSAKKDAKATAEQAKKDANAQANEIGDKAAKNVTGESGANGKAGQ